MIVERVAEIGPKVSDVLGRRGQNMVAADLHEEVLEWSAAGRLQVRFPVRTGRVGYAQSFFELDIASNVEEIELIGFRPASPKYYANEATMGAVVVAIGGKPRLVLEMYEYQADTGYPYSHPMISAIRLLKVDPDDDKVRVQPLSRSQESPYVLQNRFQSPTTGVVRRGLRLDDPSLRIVAEGDDIMVYRERRSRFPPLSELQHT